MNTNQTVVIDKKAAKLLLSLGVTPNNIGYVYINYSMCLATENHLYLTKLTKQLYPATAKRYNTTCGSVESAIRHIVADIWERNKIDNINHAFGLPVYTNSYDRPSNGEFLSLLFETIRLDIASL